MTYQMEDVNQDYDNEPDYTEVPDRCPDCGEFQVVRHTEADGAHDVVTIYECQKCGGTWES